MLTTPGFKKISYSGRVGQARQLSSTALRTLYAVPSRVFRSAQNDMGLCPTAWRWAGRSTWGGRGRCAGRRARLESPGCCSLPRRRWQCRRGGRSEEHTSELQSLAYLVCRLLLGKKKKRNTIISHNTRMTG